MVRIYSLLHVAEKKKEYGKERKRYLWNGKARKKSCFLALSGILDCKAPGSPGSSTTELAREGNAMNSVYFDLPEAFDTVSHEIRITKSTETYVATRTTQELSRLERKTLDISTNMMKKRTTRNSVQK